MHRLSSAATQARELVCVAHNNNSSSSSSSSYQHHNDDDDGLTDAPCSRMSCSVTTAMTVDDDSDGGGGGGADDGCGDKDSGMCAGDRQTTWLLNAHMRDQGDGEDDNDEPCAVVALRQEDCIPYDYDAEMGDDDDDDDVYARRSTSGGGGVAYVHDMCASHDEAASSSSSHAEPFSLPWLRAQLDCNRCYHAKAKELWAEGQLQHTMLSNETYVYAVEALIAEAARRDLRRLRAMRARAASRHTSHTAPARDVDTSAQPHASVSTLWQQADGVAYARRQWRLLLRRVRAMMCDGSLLCAREMMASLSMLNLFSHDVHMLVRELNVSAIEEQRRQRRVRAEALLATLAAQGRRFLLPTLYAYEEVAPRPVTPLAAHTTAATPTATAAAWRDGDYTLPRSCAAAARARCTEHNKADDNDTDDDDEEDEAGPSTTLSECQTDDTTSPPPSSTSAHDSSSDSSSSSTATSAQSSPCASETNSPVRTAGDTATCAYDNSSSTGRARQAVDGANYSFLTSAMLHSYVTFS